ncbi:MAG: armadillo-type fold-containing protein [Richelia sp. RM1_1_1]|nr:armadillo-type fold-containing protein [Richelia sp. SM1_7_0]NJN10343.1 armadillo-type fold-containing protein [Richelia sp. RM1_1_1]
MSQLASSSWQRLIKNTPFKELPQLKTQATKGRILQHRNPAQFLWFLTILVAMVLWNPKLLFSCGAGGFVMLLVYSMPQWDWSQFWCRTSHFLQTTRGRLVLSVTSGLFACLGTYIAATICVNSNNIWIAAGAIAQGLAIVIILILFAWLPISLYGNQEQQELEELLDYLIDTDPLKRMIGLRKLTKLATRQQLESETKQYIIECLKLLLTKESVAAIRDTAFDSLQALEPAPKAVLKNMKTLVPLSVKVKIGNGE